MFTDREGCQPVKTKHLKQRRSRALRGRAPKRGAVSAAAMAPGAERELKFEVPEAAWDALVQEMSGSQVQSMALHAIYMDTPSGDLARAHIGVRVRQEAGRWVQTLKAPGSSPLDRLEDEVALGPAHDGAAPPAADLARHRSKAAEAALRAALCTAPGEPLAKLKPQFEVKVQRRVRRVAHGRSVIELALDEGELLARGHSRPVRELELELVQGELCDLLALARRWRERWGLWLSTASKAARGNRLVADEPFGPALTAVAPQLPAKPRMGEFTAAVLHSCLEQVMGNASELAAGSADDDHVHQLRVGLRRLRAALRELPSLASDRKRFEPALIDVFRGLGERRDRTHVLGRIQPLVEAAGGTPVRLPAGFHEGTDPGELVRGSAFQDAMLGLLASAQEARRDAGEPVRRMVRTSLAKLHKQVTRDGRRFTRLSLDRQHRVRKRLKRLRYLSEFVASLYPAAAVERYLGGVKPAQEALGQYNDEIMAQHLYEEWMGSDPGARFGIEWLQARRSDQAKACATDLRSLARKRPFWDKR